MTYLYNYAIIISEQGERKPLEDLKGGINMNMMYRFRKNGKEYFAKGENRFDAQLNVELATGKKLNGGEYAEINLKEVIKMARIYTMTKQAWENGADWDTAIYNGDIETVKEFDSYSDAVEYFENELGGDAERYGIE